MMMGGYEILADYYDQFVGADYSKMTAFIHRLLQAHVKEPGLVCDVGCGSGTLLFSLFKLGYTMIGIDGSVEMLNQALQKRDQTPRGKQVLLLCQELPEIELNTSVNCFLSTLDTLNYLMEEQTLDRTFSKFATYLKPGGILIFDINTRYKFEQLLDGGIDVYDTPEVFMVWRRIFESDVCSHQLTFFEQRGHDFRRFEEEQQQRYYSPETILALLKKHRFELLGLWDDYSDREPDAQTTRLTFAAKIRKDQ